MVRAVRWFVRLRPCVLAVVVPEARPFELWKPPPISPKLEPPKLRLERPTKHPFFAVVEQLLDCLLPRQAQEQRFMPVKYSLVAYQLVKLKVQRLRTCFISRFWIKK